MDSLVIWCPGMPVVKHRTVVTTACEGEWGVPWRLTTLQWKLLTRANPLEQSSLAAENNSVT